LTYIYYVSAKKQVGKESAVFSRIDVFLKTECAGGTPADEKKDIQTEKTIKDYPVIL